jgi:hypothetical protein
LKRAAHKPAFIRKSFQRLLLCCALVCTVCSAAAPVPSENYKMHCLYLYKFSQLIKWPAPETSREFRIGVVGITRLTPVLEQYIASKNKSSAVAYKVLRFETAAAITDCEMLYIAKEQLSSFDAIVKKMTGKPTLLVTEVPGLIRRGACINLIAEEGASIKVQGNRGVIEAHQLKASPEFIKLCTEIL